MATDVRKKRAQNGKIPNRTLNLEAVGSSGVDVSGGFIREEYRAELASPELRAKVWDYMRRGDATCAAILDALELPLKRAKFEVEAASDDPEDQEVAEFVRESLFRNPRQPWSDLMEELLTYKQFGFAVFERIHEVRDWLYEVNVAGKPPQIHKREGFVFFRRFLYLATKTVWRWFFDEHGEIEAMEQFAYHFEERNVQVARDIRIPAENLTILTNRKRGQDVEGVSVYRPAHKHWRAIDALYKIQMMGLERLAMGIPTLEEPEGGATEKDKQTARQIVQRLRAHQEAGVTLPHGWKLSFAEGGLKDDAIDKAIAHHKGQILLTVFAQFLQHGQDGQSGNRALAGSMIDFFMLVLMEIANFLCDHLNLGPVRELVDLNYNVEKYPKLVCLRISDEDVKGIVDLFVAAVGGGLIHPYPSLEKHLLELLDAPQRTEEELAEEAERRAAAQMMAAAGDQGAQESDGSTDGSEGTEKTNAPPRRNTPPSTPTPEAKQKSDKEEVEKAPGGGPKTLSDANAGPVFHRPLTPREARIGAMHFTAMSDSLDEAEADFRRAAGALAERQREVLEKRLAAALNKGDMQAVAAVEVPEVGAYAALMQRFLVRLADLGLSQVAREFGEAKPPDETITAWAEARAQLLAERHASDLRFRVVGGILDAIAEDRLREGMLRELSEAAVAQVVQGDVGRMLEAFGEVIPHGR